jgi:Tol biopolymer transport system component/DNA-binding winged helix-turn-helix (wHTH) protein
MSHQPQHIYEFGPFRLDVAERLLLRDGEVVPLQPKVFDLLLALIERQGRLATKEELMTAVWPDTFVEEANIASNISILRKTISQNGQQFIETVPKRGYRFVPEVREVGSNGLGPEAHSPVAIEEKSEGDEARKRPSPVRSRRSHSRLWRGIFVVAPLVAGLLGLLFLPKPGWRQWFGAQRVNPPNNDLDIRKLPVNGNLIIGYSLSPDGRYVAYMLGDLERSGIWIRQIATGNSLRIVPLAEGVQLWGLRYSPDGDFLYYVIEDIKHRVGGTLYRISTLGGAQQKLLTGINAVAVLSPDGHRMIFKRYDRGKNFLKLANADGSETQDLDSSASFNDYYGYDWSPSGESIFYINSNQDAEDRYWRIVEKPVNGGAVRFWTEKERRKITAIGRLPAGRGLALTMADLKTGLPQIWRLPAPGAEAQRITYDAGNYLLGGLSITADGRTLLAETYDRPARVLVAPIGDPGHSKQISPGYADYDALAWTPAGELVYTLKDNGEAKLWAMKSDGSGTRQLATVASVNSQPTISPDGRFIVFVSDRNGNQNLWRTDQDGGAPLQLTRENSYEPHISPDSQWVYYGARRQGKLSLWKIPIFGGEPAVVELRSERAAISPDGRLLAYSYFDEQLKRMRVAVRPLSGGAPLKIFNAEIGYETIRWMRDSSGFAYLKGKNKIILQPLTENEPRLLLTATDDWIFSFDFSRDGQLVAYLSGRFTNDLVLIRGFLPDDAARR